MSGHAASVSGLAFSPDGRQLTSASGDSIRIWEVDSGRELHSVEIGDEKYRQSYGGRSLAGAALVFVSADGRLAAIGPLDKSMKIYDAVSGRELLDTKIKPSVEMSVAFSYDGRSFAIAKNGGASIEDLSTGRELRVLSIAPNDKAIALGVAFSPDGRLLITANRYLTGATLGVDLKVWEVATGSLLHDLDPTKKLYLAALGAISSDGGLLAGMTGNAVKLIDIATGANWQVLETKVEEVPLEESYAFKLMMNSRQALDYLRKQGITTPEQIKEFAATHRELMELNAARMEGLAEMQGSSMQQYKPADAVRFSPNGRWLVSRHSQLGATSANVWDLANGTQVRDPKNIPLSGVALPDLSPDGRFRAIAIDNVKAMTQDKAFSRAQINPKNPSSGVKNKSKTANFDVTFNEEVDLFDAGTGGKLRTLNAGTAAEMSFKPVTGFSADGNTVAISSYDGTNGQLFLYEAATGLKIGSLPVESAGIASITSIAIGPRGLLLAAGHTNSFEVLDGGTGQQLHAVPLNRGCVSLAFSPNGRVIVTLDKDGNKEIWDTKSGEKLATLVNLSVSNEPGDWLVITPDGLFDGSPAGWSRILWRFSNKTFDVAPVEWFFNEFFYPGLLSDILKGKRPKALHDISQRDRRQPQIKLSLIQDGTNGSGGIPTRQIKVKIDITDAPAGARDLRLFRNGSLVKVWRGDVLGGKPGATLEATIPIVAGANQLTAYAFNSDNVKSSDARLSLRGAESLKRAATLYVLAVGINNYANQEFNLKYAVADARAFADEVATQQMKLGKFSETRVVPLLDNEATKANILLALQRFSGTATGPVPTGAPAAFEKIKPTEPEDTLIIYYAGHGTALESRFYLIPHDLGYEGKRMRLDASGLAAIVEHSISDQEVEHAVEGLDAGQLLLVIDACNSGQALEAEEKRRGPMNSKGLAQLAYEKGMYILTAAQSYQAALEAAQLGHGYLTYALVEEGLKTAAADVAPRDGKVDVREWLDFATERVPQMQEDKLKEGRGLAYQLVFVEGEEMEKEENRNVQRPRDSTGESCRPIL
jgi:WD40 repeat protein